MADQPPLQLQIQQPPQPGFDVYAMLLQSHTASVQNTQDMRNHLRECSDRDIRNEKMFTETKQNIGKMSDKLELSLIKIGDDVNASNKWVYMIVGGITLAGALFGKLPLGKLIGL